MNYNITNKILLLLLVFSLVVSGGCADASDSQTLNPRVELDPRVEWHYGYGTEFEDHVHDGIQTTDGGYIAIGDNREHSGESSPTDILIIKIDATGKLQWQKQIGTPNKHDVGYSIAETNSGYIAGVGLFDTNRQRPGLIALNQSGDVLWQKSYNADKSGSGGFRSVLVAQDGNIIAGGYDTNPEPGFVFIADQSAFLFKVNQDGTTIWSKNFTTLRQVTKIQKTDDGYALLSTIYKSDDNDATNIAITHTDQAGAQISQHIYGENHNVQAFDFDSVNGGGFIIAGHTTGYGAVN